jgi:chromatin remodeling complex protein RSC6
LIAVLRFELNRYQIRDLLFHAFQRIGNLIKLKKKGRRRKRRRKEEGKKKGRRRKEEGKKKERRRKEEGKKKERRRKRRRKEEEGQNLITLSLKSLSPCKGSSTRKQPVTDSISSYWLY